ncbi:MAG: hypothetical protein CM15mP120_27670 [Pseudomonadota bacterium]|nr:MAG: hypothetical protein CM15mP120_27670 [Pseudomonadota bacterium]
MLSKRVIACLDVRDGKLAKSVKFVDTKDIGDPVAKAREYYEDGLDELVFYDITASSDKRNIMLDVVEAVADQVFIPLSVGEVYARLPMPLTFVWPAQKRSM